MSEKDDGGPVKSYRPGDRVPFSPGDKAWLTCVNVPAIYEVKVISDSGDAIVVKRTDYVVMAINSKERSFSVCRSYRDAIDMMIFLFETSRHSIETQLRLHDEYISCFKGILDDEKEREAKARKK